MAVAFAYPQTEQSGSVAIGDAPAAKRPTRRRWLRATTLLVFIVAVVANVVIIRITVSRGDTASTATAHPQAPTLPAPAPAPALPPGLATTFSEGKFVVGTDIAPGTYRTTGPSGHLDCYWERLKRTGGATASIIANNLGRGAATVTIADNDDAFQTRWCSTWTKVS
ncbi:MAG: hypothetical protein DLM61_10360 [Pseudonocardiales bacterium]|nr:hypothetical protein [Pseudonocardiales bacterium]PZS30582.1 MAG: hypothetical protein DLM61_10360 [Pseudonocardiales bacterium]